MEDSVALLSWFYSRGGQYRPIYYLGFTVEVAMEIILLS
jgi:hypothetical protein